MRVDVAVVGAGPAGASAAVHLGRAGLEVVVVDKVTFPRDKCCGDGLTTGALRQLDELGLDPRVIPSWQAVDGCWVRSPSGRTAEFPFSAGLYGAVARRRELDAALVSLAAASGAQVLTGHAVAAAQASDAGITLGLDARDERVQARYVIGADGVWSPLRKALGAPATGYLGEWHAFRQYVAGAGALGRRLWVAFDADLLPGYLWSFPLADGACNVGFGVRRQAGQPTRALAGVWRGLLERSHLADVLGSDASVEAPHRAWPIPSGMSAATLSAAGGRALFVGDAARAADPMTGEGIGQALETGRLAAAALLAAGPDDPAAARTAYRRSVAIGLALDHRLAAWLSACLTTPRGARGAVRIAGTSAWTRRNFARWLFEDYPRALLATPWRWHRGMLAGPPAFSRLAAAPPEGWTPQAPPAAPAPARR